MREMKSDNGRGQPVALRKTYLIVFRKEYSLLKAQWESVSPEQESHWRKFRINRERIDKVTDDVFHETL